MCVLITFILAYVIHNAIDSYRKIQLAKYGFGEDADGTFKEKSEKESEGESNYRE